MFHEIPSSKTIEHPVYSCQDISGHILANQCGCHPQEHCHMTGSTVGHIICSTMCTFTPQRSQMTFVYKVRHVAPYMDAGAANSARFSECCIAPAAANSAKARSNSQGKTCQRLYRPRLHSEQQSKRSKTQWDIPIQAVLPSIKKQPSATDYH